MKHEVWVSVALVVIFALSQLVGLGLVGRSMEYDCMMVSEEEELCGVTHHGTVIGERPPTSGVSSLVYIIFGVSLGTILLLLLVKFKKTNVWKVWFLIAVWVTSAIALGTLFSKEQAALAWGIALVLALWKLFKPNIIVYNLTEVLMYSGMAVLLAPILFVPDQSSELMSVWPALALLGIISLYDMYAVWKSKHMVRMATFITQSNSFAGLMIPYTPKDEQQGRVAQNKNEALATTSAYDGGNKNVVVKDEMKSKKKNAILGGGDVAFPLLFAGAILQARTVELVRAGVPFVEAVTTSFFSTIIIGAGATLAIAGLFMFAKKDRFYPAMPFVTAGCLLGWAVSLLVF